MERRRGGETSKDIGGEALVSGGSFICFHCFICSHPHVAENYSRQGWAASGEGRTKRPDLGPQAREFWEFLLPLASGKPVGFPRLCFGLREGREQSGLGLGDLGGEWSWGPVNRRSFVAGHPGQLAEDWNIYISILAKAMSIFKRENAPGGKMRLEVEGRQGVGVPGLLGTGFSRCQLGLTNRVEFEDWRSQCVISNPAAKKGAPQKALRLHRAGCGHALERGRGAAGQVRRHKYHANPAAAVASIANAAGSGTAAVVTAKPRRSVAVKLAQLPS